MDVILEAADGAILDDLYLSVSKHDIFPENLLHRDSIFRQTLSICVITLLGGYMLYFVFATLSFFFIYDHRNMKHPKFINGQILMEIKTSVKAFPMLTLFTVPWFIGEVRGYSKLYRDNSYGYGYLILSVFGFIAFTDMSIYWIHRWLHHPWFYNRLHKPHHKWIIPTPFASYAFHPIDSYVQSVPYYIYIFLFPFNSYIFLLLYVLINLWTISIHDGNHLMDNALVNSSSHHYVHHLEFVYNYGQYFTLWDRIGGSYKKPDLKEINSKINKIN